MKVTHWLWKQEISYEVCNLLVQEVAEKQLTKGLVGEEIKENTSIRDNSVMFAPQKHASEYILFRYAMLANKAAGWNYDLLNFVEPVQFSRYGTGEFYGQHIDSMMMRFGVFE